jgi:hypothetical protein
MDPLACWERLCDALSEGGDSLGEAAEAAEDLDNWLIPGGHQPDGVPNAHELANFRKVVLAAIRQLNLHVNPDLGRY